MADDETTDSGTSRIPGFFRLTPAQRREALAAHGFLTTDDASALATERPLLALARADHMIENVIGVMGLPLGVALNFVIDGVERVVPLCVEEPSIVAGLSAAALIARRSGGYQTSCQGTVLGGQVQLVDVANPAQAAQRIEAAQDQILKTANDLHPRMVSRGGGAQALTLTQHKGPVSGQRMLVVNLHVDTKDAMGANLVNSMCEGIAPLLAELSGGRPLLRILSNLADRSLVTAQVRLPVADLASKELSGQAVCDAIVQANDLALVDPYRAATHNKGIMNGIDALALATGNDWRAMEAAAHAYAARDGQYRALTRWYPDGDTHWSANWSCRSRLAPWAALLNPIRRSQ
jgi:hydroxymethylglutaryl-CoA reductase